jgi:hypothetical protein
MNVSANFHRVRDVFRPSAPWTWMCALLCLVQSTAWAAAPIKRARPPVFSKSVADVFFPDAREKLVGPRPEKVSAERTAAASVSTEPTDTRPDTASQGWKKLISAEAVEDEIKSQQIKFTAAVQSLTKFKGGDFQQARLHSSMLAVLFAIDAEYGETMRWQREAPAVRDLVARVGFNCKVCTDGSYKEAKACAEDLQGLVRGGSISSSAQKSDAGWSKVADRAPLMKRLEQAQQQGLAPWCASAGEFARHAERISHEAQLVAALAEVIQREGYEFADDDTYRQYAQEMQTQALAVRDAVEQKNYPQARQAVGELSKSCSHCHEGYRN